jgi:hypothetical protein
VLTLLEKRTWLTPFRGKACRAASKVQDPLKIKQQHFPGIVAPKIIFKDF